jgi:hypothetical protein
MTIPADHPIGAARPIDLRAFPDLPGNPEADIPPNSCQEAKAKVFFNCLRINVRKFPPTSKNIAESAILLVES